MSTPRRPDRPRVHLHSYLASPTDLRRGRSARPPLTSAIHMARDGLAALELYAVFSADHDYGGAILNVPPDAFAKEGLPLLPELELAAPDGLLQVTRPPLDDDDEHDRRSVQRSGAVLEGRVLAALRRFFLHCSRDKVILSDELVGALDTPEARSHRAIKFEIYNGASLMRTKDCANVDQLGRGARLHTGRTAGYLVFLPEVWAGGPWLLVSFGMNGTSALYWNHLVRTELADRVRGCLAERHPRLIVGLFEPPVTREARPSHVGFPEPADNVEVIVDAGLAA